MNLAVLLALLAALPPGDGGTAAPSGGGTAAARAGAVGGTPDGGTADGGAPGGDARPDPSGGTAGGKPDGGSDPDEDLVRHLEEIEKLELLQNLDLFDTAPDAGRKP